MTKLFEAKPFVIAEVGSNWTSYNDCKDSIAMAKAVGADAAKFQAFNGKALFGSVSAAEKDAAGEPQLTGLLDGGYNLPLDWIPKLAERCKKVGIEFLCTAFSPELVKAVDPYVEVHKIASSDLTSPEMLEAVKATGKPVILSCGASSKTDVAIALRGHEKISWKGFEGSKVVLLYCNSAYPSREHNLFLMEELKRYGGPVGYSDHSLDVIYAPLSAVKHFGAVVIEKHFKLRDDMQTPDAPHSLNPDQFQLMVDYIRGKRSIEVAPSKEEKDMLLKHNRRLIATADLKPGTTLKRNENYGAFRSLEEDSNGLSPFFWEQLEGKTLNKEVLAGKGLSTSDAG